MYMHIGLHSHMYICCVHVLLQRGDFKFAGVLCSKLMDSPFPPAWEICRYSKQNRQAVVLCIMSVQLTVIIMLSFPVSVYVRS